MKSRFILAMAAAALLSTSAMAQDISVKLGVLNDLSGTYADLAGEGSVIAARMAVEDFKAAEGIKVDIVSADHQKQAGHRLQHCAPVVRSGWRGRDPRRADLIGGAGCLRKSPRKRTRCSWHSGLKHFGPDRQGLLAQHHPLDL